MSQIWTIIFVALLAIAWALACWHDREEQKQQRQKEAASEKEVEKEKDH